MAARAYSRRSVSLQSRGGRGLIGKSMMIQDTIVVSALPLGSLSSSSVYQGLLKIVVITKHLGLQGS